MSANAPSRGVAEPRVGVVGLQGAGEPHRAAFARLGVDARDVRSLHDLEGLTHLVLPGGESTTLHHLLRLFGLWEEIGARHRAGELALFGTCAGAILLARHSGGKPPTLGVLDAVLERNAYGRQADSFVHELTLAPELDDGSALRGVFIRAPRFTVLGPDVRVLARMGDDPVAVATAGCVAAAFHPELTLDTRFHSLFLREHCLAGR
jgi:5'-phosphate synthase pdxT subunit